MHRWWVMTEAEHFVYLVRQIWPSRWRKFKQGRNSTESLATINLNFHWRMDNLPNKMGCKSGAKSSFMMTRQELIIAESMLFRNVLPSISHRKCCQGCHFLEKSGKVREIEKSWKVGEKSRNFVRYREIHLNSCEFLCIEGIPLRIAANDKKI